MIGITFNRVRAGFTVCALCLLFAATFTAGNAAPTPVTANAAAPSNQTLIYNGDTSAKSAVSVGPWGGGAASIETASDTQNGAALKIKSSDFYQGGVITLKTPVSLPTSGSGHNWYVFINLKVVQTAPNGSEASNLPPDPSLAHMADYTTGSQTAGFGQYPALRTINDADDRDDDQAPPAPVVPPTRHHRGQGAYPPNGYPGYGPNQAAPGRIYSPDVPIIIPTVRLQLTLADGSSTDVERDLPANYSQAPDEWMRIGVPVAALRFPHGITSPLQKITIGGIPAGTIWISQIGLAQDNAPITASAGPDQDVSKGDEVDFTATADGGLAGLHYAWTFRAADGTLEEASGPTASTSYNAGGTSYKVTLVVSDVDGIKKPVTTTTTVKVEE